MARPGRLVNCSLVFLLVIRCTRAPGQAGFRTESGQARTTLTEDNYRIGIGRHICSLPEPILHSMATCNAHLSASRSCACCAFHGRFAGTSGDIVVPAARSTRTFSRNTQPSTQPRNRSESRNKPVAYFINPWMRCTRIVAQVHDGCARFREIGVSFVKNSI